MDDEVFARVTQGAQEAIEIHRLRAELAEMTAERDRLRSELVDVQAELFAEQMRLNACKRDAERFRWLKKVGNYDSAYQYAIDAARKGEEKP